MPGGASPSALMPWPLETSNCAFSLRLTQAGTLPPWKGSLWRGLLGHGLRAVAASAPTPPWPGLVGLAAFSDAVFDPQLAWNDQRATAPWTLRLSDPRTSFSIGDRLDGQVLLHGPWPDWAQGLFHEAFLAGLAQGLGAARLAARLESWQAAPVPPADACCPDHLDLDLLTPARLQDRGRDCQQLEAPAIARGLLRRADQLCRQLLGQRWLDDEAYRDAAQACDLLQGDAQSHPDAAARWSNRQERTVRMATVSGRIRLHGPALATCWPWLRLAPLLNLGRQAHLSMGICQMDAVRSPAHAP